MTDRQTPDWTTPEGLAAIKDALAGQIDGWREPVAHGLGITPASSEVEVQFGHVNAPGGTHGLPAVVLAAVLGHDGSTATLPVTPQQLERAIATLEPAEACTSTDHPNLAAWRAARDQVAGNPARELLAVFVADLDDPVSSEADGTLRATFDGHEPTR